ncbi:hypothetical protein [Thermus scotoductus]|uniref:Uncharacterized protein n=1 Tax=Thermus scotoductus TaxID=37636 RepID=A0A430URJ3_THESC|nr:hypothetical protein [Thermus scotoductus]RTH26401.1 hypothetical protein CSW40_05035 [Thermus scotoductus]RTI08021.1 hypothetical protein CSW30_07665 [Thermus scotoductus]RTI10897.1 hypothetical protein CSW27_13590 [Thermus scotoductus]RTI33766.1 hypothetical protein CSW18_13560 [Thermus scotoductus]
MTQAQAFALLVRRITLNRQGTEAQVFLGYPGEEGFLYLRSDGFAHFAQGLAREEVVDFLLGKGYVTLRFQDGSTLTLSRRFGQLAKSFGP